mgnify:CR=1 FL=1
MKNRTKLPLAIRFISLISADKSSGCWNWLGKKDKKGYGQIDINGRSWRTHLFSLDYFRPLEYAKLVPNKIEPDHLCRNTSCANPYHIEMVTRHTNLIRGTSPIAINYAKKMCIHGHPFNEKNTYYIRDKHGGVERRCKECNRQRALAAYKANPEKYRERQRRYNEARRGLG